MSEKLERAIRDLLLSTEKSAEKSGQVAQSLIHRIVNSTQDTEEVIAFIYFLVNSGFFHEVINLYASQLGKGRSLPLKPLLHVLEKSGYQPDENFRLAIETAQLDINEDEFKLQSFAPWEDQWPKLREFKAQTVLKLREQWEEHKNQQLAKLDYFRVNRMIQEEEKLLNELTRLYPQDKKIQNAREQFNQRWAEEIIAQKTREAVEEIFYSNEPQFTSQEIKVARALISHVEKLVQKKPQHAYNLAIMLYFMELYDQARFIAEFAPSNPSVDWFYLDCLIRAERYAEGLDALMQLEARYNNDPETAFAVTYYRALAYDGLGQRGLATELIKSIVSIRPGYRSAHSLLHKWGGRV